MSKFSLSALRGGRLLLALALLVGTLLLLARAASSFYVEVVWFQSLGYEDVFWTRTFWDWGTKGVVAVVTTALAALNLRSVASTLGGIQIRRRFGNIEIAEQLPPSYLRWGVGLSSALLGLWFAAATPSSAGLQTLLASRAPAWGMVEPVFGNDLGFYVFLLPVLTGALALGMALVFLLFAICLAGYSATGSVRWAGNRLSLTTSARRHLSLLVGAFMLFMAARMWLGGYLLLFDGSSGVAGIFGFTDQTARLPALQGLSGLTVMAALAVLVGGIRDRPYWAFGGVGAVLLGWLLMGQLYPSFVQRFRVEPNELERESSFIEQNLRFTREGFGLGDIEQRTLAYDEPELAEWTAASTELARLPVWSRNALQTTFRAIETRFRYYDFPTVAIDRYPVGDDFLPLALSVREVNPEGIEDPNWQNLHLRERYVAGAGLVVSGADHATPQGRPDMLVSEIPPRFVGEAASAPEELQRVRPSVFVGSRPQLYAIITPSENEYRAPDGGPGVPGVDFPVGIELDSPVRKLILAWQFGAANLLFASEVTDQSRFVFRRQVTQRVRAIAPFFRFPAEPYPVLANDRIVWMIDGYTESRTFPLSSGRDFGFGRSVHYLRNSVKAVVDAITGEVSFFAVGDDPILRAFQGAFPGLVEPLESMPEELRSHLRYPAELLTLQAQVLFQYHQETARQFHGRQDVWTLAQELAEGTRPIAYRPEYALYRLPGEERPEFLLSTVLVPDGRQNLTALLVARNDGERYGELVLFEAPAGEQIPGPRQVEALVEQDPVLSQQFSLWRQGGSEVWLGHLHVIPLGNTLLYMEPIFLAAEADAIPELRRFVVSDGRRVAMESTLSGAILSLAGPGGLRADEGSAGSSSTPALFGRWPLEALDLLDRAEASLREGDYVGFGERLGELRALLAGLGRDAPAGIDPT